MSKSITEKVIASSLMALAASVLFTLATAVTLSLFVAISALSGFVLYLAWNQAVHSFLYGPTITFPQAWGISVMVGLVTGNLKYMAQRLIEGVVKTAKKAAAE